MAHVALALIERVEVELVAFRVASAVRPPLSGEGQGDDRRVGKKVGEGVLGKWKEVVLDDGLDGCAGGPCLCRCY